MGELKRFWILCCKCVSGGRNGAKKWVGVRGPCVCRWEKGVKRKEISGWIERGMDFW